MKLHSDYPFWMISEGLRNTFPILQEDVRTDVVVIGGGITGALVAHALCEAGMDVVIVEKRHVAHGSTSASTAMLQYEIDTPMFLLAQKVGAKPALRSYQLCLDALLVLEQLCGRASARVDFETHPSLWYASYKKHVDELLKPEFAARRAAGFDVEYLDEADIERKFGFKAPGALLTAQAAQVNPYLLTNHLLDKVIAMGGRIHESTEVQQIIPSARGVVLQTTEGRTLRAKYVVVAAGYECQTFLSAPAGKLTSSYAIVSKPLAAKHQWYKNALIWETRKPYHYFRTAGDNRIMIGGRDEMFYSPDKRDSLLLRKSRDLLGDFQKLFPQIPFETDFGWAGTFSETKDGLPYIGPCDHKRVLYAMGYGGNGITFSVIAAQFLRDSILGRKNADAGMFGFGR
jgi:glycine/D-amino acid oxidase-like deaminating enzyme